MDMCTPFRSKRGVRCISVPLRIPHAIGHFSMTAADDADEMALRCCVCGTSAEDDSNYLNTKMKMLISKCGHRLCVRSRCRDSFGLLRETRTVE